MTTRNRSKNRYQNPVWASGLLFAIVALVLIAAFGSAHVFLSQRMTKRENEIERMMAEMRDHEDEIKSQRSLQASLVNRETLRGRLVELNSMLIEIPVHQVRYIENRTGNPSMIDNQTGLATTGDGR